MSANGGTHQQVEEALVRNLEIGPKRNAVNQDYHPTEGGGSNFLSIKIQSLLSLYKLYPTILSPYRDLLLLRLLLV